MYINDHDQQAVLWKAFINGDMEAYATIYEKYAKVMYSYGLHYTSDYELIEDSIHDIFVKMHDNRKKLPDVNNIKLYLLISLRNTLLTKLSKSKETFKLEAMDPLISSIHNAEDRIISEEQEIQNKKLLEVIERSLSTRQKQIIYYKYVEQLSYKEIAAIMGINIQSAKNMTQITLKKIRTLFPDIAMVYVLLICFF